MSVISFGTGFVMSALAKSRPGIEAAQRPRVVVVPVDERRLLVNRDGARLEILRADRTDEHEHAENSGQ